MRAFAPICAALLLAGCSSSEAPEALSLKPEMIVSLGPNAFNVACADKGLLVQYVKHIALGEKTKANAMLTTSECGIIPADQKFKICPFTRTRCLLCVKLNLLTLQIPFLRACGPWMKRSPFHPQVPQRHLPNNGLHLALAGQPIIPQRRMHRILADNSRCDSAA
jgi:hypothetical protein